LKSYPRDALFQLVIHILWITLWINTLMSCKTEFYSQTL
jgi:hypothetical protein